MENLLYSSTLRNGEGLQKKVYSLSGLSMFDRLGTTRLDNGHAIFKHTWLKEIINSCNLFSDL